MIPIPRAAAMFAALTGLPRGATVQPVVATLPAVVVSRSHRAANDSLLITPEQLRERLGRGGVVLLHVGERADYDAGHIPGARFMPYEAITTRGRDGLMLELPSPGALDTLFESLGISDDTRIVLYWGKDWYSPTTRLFFTLDYLGLGARTSILDGGFAAWQAAGGAVTTIVSPPTRGVLTARPRPDVIVNAATLRASIGDAKVAIIDARDARFYRGDTPATRGMHARQGHVPGATNLPFNSLFDEQGRFKARPALEALLRGAGAREGKRVISYCHIGQQAAVVYFAARLLGREASLYDGSWDEWSRLEEYPVEAGATRGR